MGKEKKWISAKEYAETHDLPVSTIRRYCRAGEIPCFRIGQRFMFNPQRHGRLPRAEGTRGAER